MPLYASITVVILIPILLINYITLGETVDVMREVFDIHTDLKQLD